MGLIFNRRKRIGKRTTLNVSTRGASVSKSLGRVSINSRGRGSVRLGKGFRFKF